VQVICNTNRPYTTLYCGSPKNYMFRLHKICTVSFYCCMYSDIYWSFFCELPKREAWWWLYEITETCSCLAECNKVLLLRVVVAQRGWCTLILPVSINASTTWTSTGTIQARAWASFWTSITSTRSGLTMRPYAGVKL